MPKARCNPGAAKASDCEISKSFCALARRCYETRHPLETPLIDVCSEAETHRHRCRRVVPRVSVNPTCGIRVQWARHEASPVIFGAPKFSMRLTKITSIRAAPRGFFQP